MVIASPSKTGESGWQKSIAELQIQITNLEDLIDNIQLTPGPAGPQGEQGIPGPEMHLGQTVRIENDGPMGSQPPLTPIFYYDIVEGMPFLGETAIEDGFLMVNSYTENTCFAVIVDGNTYYVGSNEKTYGVITIPVSEGETWTIKHVSGSGTQVSIFWKPMTSTI